MSIESHLRLQYLAPQRLMSHIAHFFANHEVVWLKNFLIRDFLSRYKVNMQEAEMEDPFSYQSFNHFFTRTLKAQARPLGNGVLSPADGILSLWGNLQEGSLLQAKGQWFSSGGLLGDLQDHTFDHGSFMTIYLAPKDYHRVHLPIAGKLFRMRYIPGRLFSVNPLTTEEIPNLFARNERVVLWFDTEHGKLALVLVGAMIVGSIHTPWHGVVNPKHTGQVITWDYPEHTPYALGANIGHFCLGSTVIVLTEKKLNFHPTLANGLAVQMGQSLAMPSSSD